LNENGLGWSLMLGFLVHTDRREEEGLGLLPVSILN